MNLEEVERDTANKFIDGILDLGLDRKKLIALLYVLLEQSRDVELVKETVESWGVEAREKWNNGTNYEESLRDADTRLLTNIGKEIDELIALGVTVWEASEYLGQRLYSTRVHDLSRILVTESTRILAAQELKRGDSYIYRCVGDSRTCPECIGLSGRVFLSSDAEYGLNLPPIHPWCRCWIEKWTN